MNCTLSLQQVDEWIELARQYCSRLAAFRAARTHGTLSTEQDAAALAELAELDARIERLKHGPVPETPKLRRRRPARNTVRLRRMVRRLTR